jgi:RNA polymerase sigma-70 factor (ECF subfamily)
MVSISMETIKQTTLDDETLAIQALGDSEAFAELYRRHFQAVYRYHLARTGNIPEAQDITTLTFVAALDGLERYRGTGSFTAWLFGIARRQHALHYRQRKREVDFSLTDDLTDPAPAIETLVEQKLQISHVSQLLNLLNKDRREALLLCLFSELPVEEAASVMGKSPAAVKMLLFRGLRDLRQIFAAPVEEIA